MQNKMKVWEDIIHKYLLNILYIIPENFANAGYWTVTNRQGPCFYGVDNLLERERSILIGINGICLLL